MVRRAVGPRPPCRAGNIAAPPGTPQLCGTLPRVPHLRITQDDATDHLPGRDPLALVLGMLFDQQFGRCFLALPTALVTRSGGEPREAAGRFRWTHVGGTNRASKP